MARISRQLAREAVQNISTHKYQQQNKCMAMMIGFGKNIMMICMRIRDDYKILIFYEITPVSDASVNRRLIQRDANVFFEGDH